jgi:hypothetical protein
VRKNKIKNPLIKFENKWVALRPDGDEVVESGNSLNDLEKKLAAVGVGVGDKSVVLTKVLPFDVAYCPHAKLN